MASSEPQGEAEEPVNVARRCYVGNLAWTTTWQNLKDFFQQAGPVRYANILREGGPGTRSKGCGIVEFERSEDAVRAIHQLHGSELNGRRIFVREDREDHELRGGEGGAAAQRDVGEAPRRGLAGGYEGAVMVGRRVYVGNLAYDTSWQELKDHFRQAGPVVRADILLDSNGWSKGCALVEFQTAADALRAISLLSNSVLNGRQILVREDREEPGLQLASAAGRWKGAAGGRGGGGGGGGPWAPADPQADCEDANATTELPRPCAAVEVFGLPDRLTPDVSLEALFREVGRLVDTHVPANPDGSTQGFGFATFSAPEEAEAAVRTVTGRVVGDRRLTVAYNHSGQPTQRDAGAAAP